MDATYRTLSTALTLTGPFTVADLAGEADVKEATVRTVLNRSREYFVVTRERTNKRGGQRQLWSIADDRREALEATLAGIDERFSDQRDTGVQLMDSGWLGPRDGPPLRVPSTNPELVTADDLDTYPLEPSIDLLPKLVQRLVLGAEGIQQCSMPTGEGIRAHGYDGHVVAMAPSFNIPAGLSVWEFGAGYSPSRKISEDLTKRVKKPRDVDPSTTTYVAVAFRRFSEKYDWVTDHRASTMWHDLVVLDADDLYGWVLRQPFVHAWLSAEMGLHPTEVVTLASWFASWQAQTNVRVGSPVLLAGRQVEADDFRQRVAVPGQIVHVQSGSREESLAWIAAALGESDEATPGALRLHSALLVKTRDEWARLCGSIHEGILVPEFPGADVALASSRGLTVALALGPGGDDRRMDVNLPRIDLIEASNHLVRSGLKRDQADRIAHEVDRSLTSFRRTDAVNSDQPRPGWATEDVSALAPLVLLGAWNAESTLDHDIVAEVAGRAYTEIEAMLTRLALSDDPPFFGSGGNWQVSSAHDAFVLTRHSLTSDHLDRWRAAASRVLTWSRARTAGGADGRPTFSPDEMASSTTLQGGMARGAAILGTLGDPAQAQHAHRLVRDLLGPSTTVQDWIALASVLPTLAEAAPDDVLNAIDDSLGDPPLLSAMFADSGADSYMASRSPHTELLWTLEMLCRSNDHASRACFALARLDELDPGGRGANRPIESLRRVLLPWHPQIALSAQEQMAVVEGILTRYPETGWRLVLGLLPGMFDSTHPTYRPAVRDWRIDSQRSMTERFASWKEVTALALKAAVDGGPERMVQLVETIQTLSPENRSQLLAELLELDPTSWEPGVRLRAWRALSEVTTKHRQFPEAQWVMPDTELTALEGIAHRWTPTDLVDQYAHLFRSYPDIPVPRVEWESGEYEQAVENLQKAALTEIRETDGLDGLVRLGPASPEPRFAGTVIARDYGDLVTTAMQAALADSGPLGETALGWLWRMSEDRGADWLSTQLRTISELPDDAKVRAYQALTYSDLVLDLIPKQSSTVQNGFWRLNPLFLLSSDRVEDVTRGFLEHGQAGRAVTYLAHKRLRADVRPDLIVAALRQLATEGSAELANNMVTYEVGELLDLIEAHSGFEGDLVDLEWALSPVLQYTRSPRALYHKLANSPAFFVELVSKIYRGSAEPTATDEDFDPAMAAEWRTSYAVLREWRIVPGTCADGTIDLDVLRQWVSEARLLLASVDRVAIGDQCIGQLLSGSPDGSDGIWPAEPVRDLLEELRGSDMRDGIEIGRFNARAVTSRGAFDGGRQERALSATYDRWSRAVATRWPNTARILRDLARNYEEWAEREDERDERWRDLS